MTTVEASGVSRATSRASTPPGRNGTSTFCSKCLGRPRRDIFYSFPFLGLRGSYLRIFCLGASKGQSNLGASRRLRRAFGILGEGGGDEVHRRGTLPTLAWGSEQAQRRGQARLHECPRVLHETARSSTSTLSSRSRRGRFSLPMAGLCLRRRPFSCPLRRRRGGGGVLEAFLLHLKHLELSSRL